MIENQNNQNQNNLLWSQWAQEFQISFIKEENRNKFKELFEEANKIREKENKELFERLEKKLEEEWQEINDENKVRLRNLIWITIELLNKYWEMIQFYSVKNVLEPSEDKDEKLIVLAKFILDEERNMNKYMKEYLWEN